MGDFFKQFERHLENVASVAVANAASALDEYPDQGTEQNERDSGAISLSAAFERKALEYWREANIEGKRSSWNEKRLEIEQAQRSDRSEPPPAPSLRSRLSSAESLLLTLLDLLVEAPDPAHDLAVAASHETKIERLKKDVERLRAEAGEAAEVGELREKVRGLERSLGEANSALQSKSEELEKVVAAQAELNMQEIQARDAAQAAELSAAQERLRTMMEEHERAQSALFELTARSEEERAAQAAQGDIAAAEMERAQQQVVELEAARAELTKRLAGMAEEGQSQGDVQEAAGGDTALRSLEVMMAAKDHMLEQLRGQLATSSRDLGRVQMEAEKVINAAAEAKEAAEARAEELKRELATREDPAAVEALRRQVVSLASLVDSSMEAEGWAAGNGAGKQSQGADKSTVQSWLQERNKRLADEVTSLRRRLSEAESANKAEAAAATAAREEAAASSALVTRLEKDLEAASSQTGPVPMKPVVELEEMVGGVPGGGGSAEELLRIVAGQRDRYRAAQGRAEEELSAAQATLAKRDSELEVARKDSVALYEKVRYLESYSAQQLRQIAKMGGSAVPPIKVDDAGVPVALESAAAARYSCGPLSVSVGGTEDGGDVVSGRLGAGGLTRRGLRYQCGFGEGDEEEGGPERYRREYEQRLNPFERFKQREAAAGVAGLGASDRAVLAGGQLLAGSKMARAFLATYAALLHVIVFAVLYTAAS